LIPKSTIRIQVDGKFVGAIYEVAAKFGGVTSGEEYEADGNLAISITCETSVEEAMRQLLQDSTRGQAVFFDEN
jgi:ribosome maturation protein Sdo1